MVDKNSPEFQIGKKIGQALAAYIGVRMLINGTKMILKSVRALLITAPKTPL